MAVHRRIEVTNMSGSAGEVALVRFVDPQDHGRIIQELGTELMTWSKERRRTSS
jgi:hypothetical protein